MVLDFTDASIHMLPHPLPLRDSLLRHWSIGLSYHSLPSVNQPNLLTEAIAPFGSLSDWLLQSAVLERYAVTDELYNLRRDADSVAVFPVQVAVGL